MPPTLRGCITVQRVRILSASHRLPFAFFQTVTQQPADQKHPQYHCRPSEQETLSGRPSSTTSCVVDRTGRTARVASTVNSVPCICFGRRQPLDERRRREISAANIAWLHCTHRCVGLTPSRHRIVNLTTTVNPASVALPQLIAPSSSSHISRRRLPAKQILNSVRFIRLPEVGYIEGILECCCVVFFTRPLNSAPCIAYRS